MPEPMIADTAAPAAPSWSNAASSVVTASGMGVSLHDDLGDDAERAFRADEGADQVVAGRAPVPSPSQVSSPCGVTISQPGHVVDGEAVLEAVRAAGVLRHVAADRADRPGWTGPARRTGRTARRPCSRRGW